MLWPGRALIPIAAVVAVCTTLVAVPASGSAPRPQAHASADVSGWSANAVAYRGQNGSQFTADCPAYGTVRSIYGTDVYTDDSSICTAAVHVGRISLGDGGTVTFEIRPDAGSYAASTRNRVTSSEYGAWVGSFAIVGASPNTPVVGTGASGWNTNAATFRNWPGTQYRYNCPANGVPGAVWGTNVYTDDSSVCTAAVHGGLISLKSGGKVTIKMRDGQASYRSSTRNKVKSQAYGAWPASFIVVGAPDGPDDPDGIATGNVLVNGQPFTTGTVKYGATVDVSGGTLTLTAPKVGTVLTFGDGTDLARYKLVKLTQKVKKQTKIVGAQLALSGGDFTGCSAGTARAAGKPVGKIVRSLWSSGKGKFQTKGKYASATVRGTKWQTTDQCDGTLTTVSEGAVTVRDFALKKNVVVRAPGSYLAKSP